MIGRVNEWSENFAIYANTAIFIKDGKHKFFLPREGKILFDYMVDEVGIDFINVRKYHNGLSTFGLLNLRKGDKYNIIDTINGKLLCNEWLDNIPIIVNDFLLIEKSKKKNFINSDGILLCKEWFDDFFVLDNGIARITIDDKINFIETKVQHKQRQ